MKKKKLNSKDGSEFTVFYLKDKESEPNKMSDKEDIAAQNLAAAFSALGGSLPKLPISNFFGASEGSVEVLIDDTIESDFLDTDALVVGRIYRVHELNSLIIRYNGLGVTSRASSGVTSLIVLKVSHNDFHFWVNEKSLIKANKDEVNFYLNKTI
jgi:hypothetical protein